MAAEAVYSVLLCNLCWVGLCNFSNLLIPLLWYCLSCRNHKMGLKRSFEFEDFQEHHKHPKPVESDFYEAAQFHGISSEPDISVNKTVNLQNYVL